MKRVIIEYAACLLCVRYRGHGPAHHIVTAHFEGDDVGMRLTTGCKATSGGRWHRLKRGMQIEGKTRQQWRQQFLKDAS